MTTPVDLSTRYTTSDITMETSSASIFKQ